MQVILHFCNFSYPIAHTIAINILLVGLLLVLLIMIPDSRLQCKTHTLCQTKMAKSHTLCSCIAGVHFQKHAKGMQLQPLLSIFTRPRCACLLAPLLNLPTWICLLRRLYPLGRHNIREYSLPLLQGHIYFVVSIQKYVCYEDIVDHSSYVLIKA